jgi:biotin transporter BioY
MLVAAGAHGNVTRMFGPLNGVRVALVASAVIASIVAFATGFPLAGAILAGGVLVHGAGWLYLYTNRERP